MEIFDFDYHTPSSKYPEGDKLKLGGSYSYTPEPTSPDQRIITLDFPDRGMAYFWNTTTNAPDFTTRPEINFNRLEAFYQRHRMWKSFIYVHPTYGQMIVKFNRPLQTPKAVRGGYLPSFALELEEQV